MHKILSKLISIIKQEKFELDSNIPISYIINTIIKKTIMIIRGLLVVSKKQGLLFIGKNTVIKCQNKISFGKNVNIDNNCYIDALSIDGIKIGNNVSIHKNTIIECTGSVKLLGKGLKIGNNVGIGSNSFLGCAGGINIGDDTIIGNYVSFHSENHNYENINIPIRLQGVNHQGITIENDCWIGAKVTILDGSYIGQGSIIGAGSVVRGYIPPYSIAAGVPAKIIKARK